MMNQFLITIIFLIPAANMQMSRVPQPYTGKIKICVQAGKTLQHGMCACVCVCVKVCVKVKMHWQMTCLRDQDRLL